MRRGDFLRLLTLSAIGLVGGAGVGLTTEQQLTDLRLRIEALEKKAKKAEGALILGPHQSGPLPGWMRATRIEGQQMLLDMTQSKAGVAPRISVTDTAGITRAELGNLANYTGPNGVNSPAQYGFRANDSTGNAIFDSLGLIAVMKQLAQTGPNGAFLAGATMATLSFTLTRAVTVWIIGIANLRATGGGAVDVPDPVFIDGSVLQPGIYDLTAGNAVGFPNTLLVTPQSLAAGSHSYTIVNSSGVTLNLDYSNFLVFQLGA